MTQDAKDTMGYNPWEPVFDFEQLIHKYIMFLRRYGNDWREGVKLINWMEDVRKGEPYGEGLSYRLGSYLLRPKRLCLLPEGKD
jgi:hypothetical protein